jgi:hypothetical protein
LDESISFLELGGQESSGGSQSNANVADRRASARDITDDRSGLAEYANLKQLKARQVEEFWTYMAVGDFVCAFHLFVSLTHIQGSSKEREAKIFVRLVALENGLERILAGQALEVNCAILLP